MIYSFDGRVRYSEIGENGLLTLPGVLNYFQDCSTFQSEEVGLGIKVLKEWKRFWVLSAWQVIVERYPAMGEQIRTSTWAYGFRGFMGFRNFTMDTMEGERLAYANTFWTYINRENDFPVKLTERDTEGYGLEEKLEMDYAPRKIVLPKEYTKEDVFYVQKHHLDTNHHVNNCQYVQMALEMLPGDVQIRQVRVDYKKSAVLGDMVCPRLAEENDRTVVELCDRDGKPYAVVELK